MTRRGLKHRFVFTYCLCRPSAPFRGKQYVQHLRTRKENAHKFVSELQLCLCGKEGSVLPPKPTQDELELFYKQHENCNSELRSNSPAARRIFAEAEVFLREVRRKVEEEKALREAEGEVDVDAEEEKAEKVTRLTDSESEEESEDASFTVELEGEKEDGCFTVELEEESRAMTAAEEQRTAVKNVLKEMGRKDSEEELGRKDSEEYDWSGVFGELSKKESEVEETRRIQAEKCAAAEEERRLTAEKDRKAELVRKERKAVRRIRKKSEEKNCNFKVNLMKDRLERERRWRMVLTKKLVEKERKEKISLVKEREMVLREKKMEEREKTVISAEKVCRVVREEAERKERAIKGVEERMRQRGRELTRREDEVMEKEKSVEEMAERREKEVEKREEAAEAKEKKLEKKDETLKNVAERLKGFSKSILGEETVKERVEETTALFHIPIEGGIIAGDPCLVRNEERRQTMQCYRLPNITCGHIAIVLNGELKSWSWRNMKSASLPLKRRVCEETEDEADFVLKRRK